MCQLRFGFPRLPSVRTIIARPEKCTEEYDAGQVALGKVKKVLTDDEVMAAIKEEHPLSNEASEEEYVRMREVRIRAVLQRAGVDFEKYHEYLAMSRTGVKVVLQRDIAEIHVNNYNAKWLLLWDGNMDLSPVKDFFAVLTYITEYAFKPEPQELEMRRLLELVKDENIEKQMRVIAQAFQDTREMGFSEALYKLLPELVMTNSNVKKQWVCVGKEEERTTRARKATKGDIEAGHSVFQIEGVEGEWMEQWDMRSKYVRRDPKLWNISFSQFARMLEATSASRKTNDEETDDQPEEINFEEGEEETAEENKDKDEPWYVPFEKVMMCSHRCCTDNVKEDCEDVCCQANPSQTKVKKKKKKLVRATEVPQMMELRDVYGGEPRFMKRRQIPAVLRFYKSNKDTNPLRFFLQELILFVPFGLEENSDMQNLLQEADDQIVLLYEKYQHHVKEVKRQVLPFIEDVTEERFYVEEIRRQMELEEIGQELAPGKELDNMEALDAEVRYNFSKYLLIAQ